LICSKFALELYFYIFKEADLWKRS